jgi:hypothetical protein
VKILREAHDCAYAAYELFESIGDRPRQIESLIEVGNALRVLIGIKRDHPNLQLPWPLENDLNKLLQQSVQALERATDLARQTNNVFRLVDAWINIAYAGFDGERPDIIERGLVKARTAIPDHYLITRHRIPDSRDQSIQNPQVFNQLARIHMLIGYRLFAHYQRLNRSAGNVKDVAQEYARIATLFVDETPADFQAVDDCLRYAIRHYALAFECDRVFIGSDPYTLSDPGGLRGQDRVYNRLKDLSAEELDIVAEAVRTFERDYPVGRSAMRDLLERRALLIE